MFNWRKDDVPLTEEERTQKIHQRVRNFRKSPEALDDLPVELFLRLVGIFFTIPEEVRDNSKNASTSKEFIKLRDFIDEQLACADGKNFAKYEMGDYVHNLYLLLVGIVKLDYLEANIHNIREEYRGHAGEVNYRLYLQSKSYMFLNKYQNSDPSDENFKSIKEIYEQKLRVDYGNLINEIRRAKLFEKQIEDTRGYLIEKVFKVFILLILPPLIFIIFFVVHYGGNLPADHIDEFPKNEKSELLIGFVLICSSALAGATGSLVSVLLRIQGVRDNNQLAQNIFAFKYSKASLQIAPFTGMVFAILLSFILYAGLIGGSMFPNTKDSSWIKILFDMGELAKLLVWCFIAGFSERLMPDMVDRLSDKAKKADEK